MKQYSCPLLALLLSVVSSFMCIPCRAEVATEANTELNNNISSEKTSFNKNERSPVSNTDDSANAKSTVISENSENTASLRENQANLQPKFRIPISSRIFAAPSMQQ
ncbi:hypothetical protein LC593_01165 [Nostoc sp. CHAB 5844]|nr:hypothetical protein [Nostoc sp. CHAB 5844]